MLKIVFMGTPEFAIPALDALDKSDLCTIKAIVTQPDRPRGRGKQLLPPPVKIWGQKRNIHVLQPEKASSQEFITSIKNITPDLIITAAYGQILKKELLDIPGLGCINIHASLLPEYRGASPIQQVLIDGKDKTGITIMYMGIGMDTGDIIASRELKIKADENAGELHDRLAILGGHLLSDIIPEFIKGKPKGKPQDESKATYCSKIDKAMGEINWDDSAANIINKIRGLTPWPGAYTYLDGRRLKVWKAGEWEYSTFEEAMPGTVIRSNIKEGLAVKCRGGAVRIIELQGESGKPLTAEDYLKGHKLPEGTVLG